MKTDAVLKWIILILTLAGFFILASASIGLAAKKDLPGYYYIFRQFLFGGLPGLVALVIASKIPYKAWRKFALPLFVFSLILAGLVLLPSVGLSFGGARRWIGFGPINFQPSELLKFSYLLYLAAFFNSQRENIKSFYHGFLPFLIITSLAGTLIILEPDIGTFGVLAISGLIFFFGAGGSLKHIMVLGIMGILLFLILVNSSSYRFERIKVFFNPEYDPQGSGYQLKQALIAIGSGEIFGRGFGMSRQKFEYLPEPVGDSIFAVAAEEFGFLGSAALILLFLVFAWRGLKISLRTPDNFGRLLGCGIVILITVQSLVNIAALSGLMPLTGIPLLFISLGGSALAMTLGQAGILLNISKARS